MARRSSDIIVGLDIGTTKIAAVVAEMGDDGLDIIGIGTHPSRGLKKGVIVNIDSTVAAIKQAVLEAEGMSGCEISQVYVGIAGGHIKGINSTGTVAVKDKEVRASDVAKVLELARAIALPADRHVVHVLPQEYKIDGQDGVREPLGMCGVRLEARVHIVTAAAAAMQNVIKCCSRCELEVLDIVLEPLASGEAVLEEDEKGLGVALVDIGGGTTDIAIFTEGSVAHTSVIPLGGYQITSRHRVWPAHTAARGREDQAPVGLRPGQHGGRGRDHPRRLGGWAGAARACHARCSAATSSSRASKRSFRSSKPRSRAWAATTCWPRARSSPAARRSCPAWPSWPRIFSAFPCASASPRAWADWPTWSNRPASPPAVGLVQYAANQQAGLARSASEPGRNGMFGRIRRVLSNAF